MGARKYAFGALFALSAFFGSWVAAVAGSLESECPPGFDFENAMAKDLTKCDQRSMQLLDYHPRIPPCDI